MKALLILRIIILTRDSDAGNSREVRRGRWQTVMRAQAYANSGGPPQPASLHLWQMNGLPRVSMWFSLGSLPQCPQQGQLDLTCRTQSCVLNKCSSLSTWAVSYNVLCVSTLHSLTQYQRLRNQLGKKQASKSGSTIDRGFFWSGHGNAVPTSSLDQNIRSPELYFQFSPWGLLLLFTVPCTSTFFICKMDTAPPDPLHRLSQETV